MTLKQNIHLISLAFRMHLVKDATASPRAKFYSLSTAYDRKPNPKVSFVLNTNPYNVSQKCATIHSSFFLKN